MLRSRNCSTDAFHRIASSAYTITSVMLSVHSVFFFTKCVRVLAACYVIFFPQELGHQNKINFSNSTNNVRDLFV